MSYDVQRDPSTRKSVALSGNRRTEDRCNTGKLWPWIPKLLHTEICLDEIPIELGFILLCELQVKEHMENTNTNNEQKVAPS